MHTDGPGLIAKYHWMLHKVRLQWRYLIRVNAAVRLQTQHKVTEGRTERVRPQGPTTDRERNGRMHIGLGTIKLQNGESHKAVFDATERRARAKGKQH